MRQYVVSNSSREAFGSTIGDIDGYALYSEDKPVRSYTEFATLNALGPFLAYHDLGDTFKWAFVGTMNADTAFFPRAAANAIKDLDPNMPYFLTGVAIVASQCLLTSSEC